MRIRRIVLAASVLALVATACGSGAPARLATSSGALALSGRVDAASFPLAATEVRALRGNQVVARAPVGLDGAFVLSVPAGVRYRLDFAYGPAAARLVFPRAAGAIDSAFDVTGDGAFDLGTVRYVGDPTTHTFRYRTTTGALTDGAAAGTPDGDTDDVECEDGIDPATGAICVDDDGGDAAGMCGDDQESEDDAADGDTDDVECEDGVDLATGAECDGGPAANADDDGAENGEAEDGPGDGDTDQVECEDGVDPATGAECDGGPAANADDGAEGGSAEAGDAVPTDAAMADHNLPSTLGCAAAESDDDQDDPDEQEDD